MRTHRTNDVWKASYAIVCSLLFLSSLLIIPVRSSQAHNKSDRPRKESSPRLLRSSSEEESERGDADEEEWEEEESEEEAEGGFPQTFEEPAMLQKLDQTVEAVNALSRHAFKKRNRKKALKKKLRSVREMLFEGEYEEALEKLENDILGKMNGCAESGAPDRNDWLRTCDAQTEIYALVKDTMNLVTLWYESLYSTFEESPEWEMPDLAVTGLTMEPERTDPGSPVTLRATVVNKRKGEASSAILTFLVDDEVVERRPVGNLGPGAEVELTALWTATTPGRHWVRAEIGNTANVVDQDWLNNYSTGSAWVSGEENPEPEMLFSDINLAALELTIGEPAVIPVKVRNPSFASINDITAVTYIDGQPYCPPPVGIDPGNSDVLPGGGICLPNFELINLGPGEEQELHISWNEVTPGEHLVQLILSLPETYPDAQFQYTKTWQIIIPYLMSAVCSTQGKDKWISIGPSTLTDIPTNVYGHTHYAKYGNVGRMDHIAFHPTDINIMYATAPNGGLWKSTNRGGNWFPLTDGLDTLNTGAVAVASQHPDDIYLATDKGIYKSLDGGTTWSRFAERNVVGNVREIVVRNTSAGEVLIYAAGDKGVLRYKNSDHLLKKSAASEWINIKSGSVTDMAVSPYDYSLLYVSMDKLEWSTKYKHWFDYFAGLYRTRKGDTASDNSTDWEALTTGLPAVSPTSDPMDRYGAMTIDIWAGNPMIMYAALYTPPANGGKLAIYWTVNEGSSWTFKEHLAFDGYNAFTRIDPSNGALIYFGGVHLFMRDFSDPHGTRVMIGNNEIHDDMKDLTFDPFNSSYYYVLSDGSIWHCKAGSASGCTAKSYDLRTTRFFDFDISGTSSNLIIGGTQDTGTILYQGSTDWKSLKGGDGNYALIAPGDKLYAQQQRLRDTVRCDRGAGCGWPNWAGATGVNATCKPLNTCNKLPDETGWGFDNAYITYNPNDSHGNFLLAQGKQVHMTTDGGKNWYTKGPAGVNVKTGSFITRVVVQPTTSTWIAGNSKGQIWYTRNPNAGWYLLGEHPYGAAVVNMAFAPTDYKLLYVIFDVGGAKAYTRIYRYEMNPGPPLSWSAYPITDNFPLDLKPQTIAGDGHSSDTAYVGTDRGGVLRWDGNKPTYDRWQKYNLCLPGAVDIKDLIVGPDKVLHAATWGRGAWKVVTGP